MNLTQSVKTNVTAESASAILGSLKNEFSKVSQAVNDNGNALTVTGVACTTPGAFLRADVTTVKLESTADGYVINCGIEYKPSTVFWIWIIIDLVLITTLIGFFVGIGITLGLFFYNKSQVQKTVQGVLNSVPQNIG